MIGPLAPRSTLPTVGGASPRSMASSPGVRWGVASKQCEWRGGAKGGRNGMVARRREELRPGSHKGGYGSEEGGEGGTGGDVAGEASWGVMWLIEVEALMMWMTAFSLMTLAMTR